MAPSQSQSKQPFFLTKIMIKALITVWEEADIWRIMDGKMKNLLAYMKMVERLNARGVACSKAQLISKIKHSSPMDRKTTDVVQVQMQFTRSVHTWTNCHQFST